MRYVKIRNKIIYNPRAKSKLFYEISLNDNDEIMAIFSLDVMGNFRERIFSESLAERIAELSCYELSDDVLKKTKEMNVDLKDQRELREMRADDRHFEECLRNTGVEFSNCCLFVGGYIIKK